MAMIKATWKRTVRIREYEGETLELSVERGWDELNDGDAVNAAVDLDRELARAGDSLVAERLSERLTSLPARDRLARVSPGSRPEALDDYVV
jgi:hypothetical protein